MDMAGEQFIAASREVVWAALNDPEILQRCIPGCQEVVKQSETGMTAAAVIKVGPVSARFRGMVTLSDLDPPNGYRISGEGQGGIAGFAKGTAVVRLEPNGEGTLLHYDVSAQVGGKLSQLGGRLIDATARKMSDAFFKRFAEEISAKPAEEPQLDQAGAARPEAAAEPGRGAGETARSRARVDTVVPDLPPATPGSLGWAQWLNAAVLVVALIVMGWSLSSAGVPRPTESTLAVGAVSAEFMIAVHLVLVAAVGYLLGRQHEAAQDRALVRQLLSALMRERRGRTER